MRAELRMLAWESTRRCNLRCQHCRASATYEAPPGELTTEEVKALIDHISAWARPVLILSGGEPLLREDIFEIARHGTSKGLRVVLATNGTLLNPGVVSEIKAAGIRRVSVSLDWPHARGQDAFRGVEGAFEGALEGIRYLREGRIEVQVNTTVTRDNAAELPALLRLSEDLGAVAHHVFFLVPTGRGKELEGRELDPEGYEEALGWLCAYMERTPLEIKPTCAPQFYRILHQAGRNPKAMGKGGLHTFTRGCLGGISFLFLSSTGEVQPCGYFELSLGNVRERPLKEIWEGSPVLRDLRDPGRLKGKCGRCRYRFVCGGCRARALALKGDYLAEEPYCLWEPEDGALQ